VVLEADLPLQLKREPNMAQIAEKTNSLRIGKKLCKYFD